jgi:ATP-binding cassette subfamily F protein 3
MVVVTATNLRKELSGEPLFDGVSFKVERRDRVSLSGPNGAGKTTLLRLLNGETELHGGTISMAKGTRIALHDQRPPAESAATLRDYVLSGAADLTAAERELRRLEEAMTRGDHEPATLRSYAETQARLEHAGGYAWRERLDSVTRNLGFSTNDLDRPLYSFSGGELTRASLARSLGGDPDLLLLDEPTNHLDLDALEWVEEHLRRRAGSLLVASHDRAFLDATVTRIWELRDRRITVFRGDYSAYHRQRIERDERAVKDAEGRAGEIAREQELVQRYRSHRKFSKQHEHEARLERLEAERREAPRASRKLAIPTTGLVGGAGPSRSGEIVVRVEDLAVGYLPARPATAPDGSIATAPKIVARAPFLAAQRGERIGIVGPNGAGKTTLLRTIAGDLPPLDGAITFGNAVQIGYLAQLRSAAITGATVLDALLEAAPVTAGEARAYLARFLFRGDDAFKEVRLLSGGERSRLELALLGIQPSNLLLLDEPTNHLDIPAREAIEAFMAASPATLLVVSHDRRLLETVCDKLWVVGNGAAVAFDGGYREWRAAVAGGWTVEGALAMEAARGRGSRRTVDHPLPGPYGAAPDGTGPRAPAGASEGGVATQPANRKALGKKEKLSKEAYRRQKASAEAELTRLGLRKSHLELSIGDPSIQANFVEMRRVTSELADIDVALAAAEDAWLDLEERAP